MSDIPVIVDVTLTVGELEPESYPFSEFLEARVAAAASHGRHGASNNLGNRAGRPNRGHVWAGSRRGTHSASSGEPGVAYGAGSITNEMGISQSQYDAFREGVTDIEGKEYGHMGGGGGRYAGRYQLGPAEITETAARLGVSRPDTGEFLTNKQEQEQFFENYTLDHYRQMNRNAEFQNMPHERQLEMLGYAHNQGVGGALHYINTGRAGADAWGTSGTAYFDPIRRRYQDAAVNAAAQSQPKMGPE